MAQAQTEQEEPWVLIQLLSFMHWVMPDKSLPSEPGFYVADPGGGPEGFLNSYKLCSHLHLPPPTWRAYTVSYHQRAAGLGNTPLAVTFPAGWGWNLSLQRSPCPFYQKDTSWASLVVQWLRIHLPMQGTWVRALVREDPTCRGVTKPVSHNYRACALGPVSHSYWARVPQLLKPVCLKPVLHNKRSHRNEKPTHCNKE